MKKLGEIICDGCRSVIPAGLRPITITGKKGQELHFCEKVACVGYKRQKGRPKIDLQSIIRDDQAAEFITESNAIEAIDFPYMDAAIAWGSKQSKVPEIGGQVSALNYTLRNYKKDLSVDQVVKLHTLLMKGLLPKHLLGIRTDWVRVGGRVCPPPIAIRPMLEAWCKKVNSLTNPTEEEVWQTHLAYETIHPFIDGNGRSGRLLWLWLRYKYGFGYKCIYNSTKFDQYYPQFNIFVWDSWINA